MKFKRLPSLTWVAEDSGSLVGALGLDWEEGVTVAGPLVLDRAATGKVWIALRLVEAMEAWMAKAGATTYVFGVARSNTRWNTIVQRFAERYTTKDGRHWYTRRLEGSSNGGSVVHRNPS